VREVIASPILVTGSGGHALPILLATHLRARAAPQDDRHVLRPDALPCWGDVLPPPPGAEAADGGGRHRMTLVDTLRTVLQRSKEQKHFDNAAVAQAFVTFFLNIFGTYRRFIVETSGKKASASSSSPALTFDQDAFVNSHSAQVQQFLRQFENAQMFEQWRAERATTALKPVKELSMFERATADLHEKHLQMDVTSKMWK